MKKIVCVILTLYLAIQFSYAQIAPLEVYSSYRFYNSDKTPTGSGFKLRNFIKIKHECSFSIYADHVTYKNIISTNYKIYNTKRYSNTDHYLAHDSTGQYFDIVIEHDLVDKKHYYDVTLMKTDKSGIWLSVTRFDVNRIK